MIKDSRWQLLNGCISLKILGPSCNQHLVTSWQEALLLCELKPSPNREHYNSLQKELLVSSRLPHLGIKEVEDIIEAPPQRNLEFLEPR